MTMPHLMNCGHSETGWCLMCVHELNARLELSDELGERLQKDFERTKCDLQQCLAAWAKDKNAFSERIDALESDRLRLLAEGRHAKACFDAAQEQAVRLAGELDRLTAENAKQLEEIVSLGGNLVFLLEQENAGLKEELEAFKRLRDELIELNDRLKCDVLEAKHKSEVATRIMNEADKKRALTEIRLERALAENDDLETAINNALELVNRDCPSMDKFVNIVPTVAWLLQKWRECRKRWQDAVAKVAVADDDHHAMMNGPRIAQALGLNPSDTPRTDAVTIACGWDTTHPVVRKTFAQELEREIGYREQQRREIQKDWERSHDAWRNAQVRIEALILALKETNRMLACEPQAWTQAKTDQMRRNHELINGRDSK